MANCIRCGRQLPPLTFGKKICQWCVQHEAAQRGEDTGEMKQVVIPAPWVRRSQSSITLTHILFGANMAVFLAMVFASGNPAAFLNPSQGFSGQVSIHFGANYGPKTLSGDWWRLFTYMFLHGSLMHIGFNMWCLWDLGKLCESLYGRWTYAAIYLITGVSGGLASVAWNPGVWSVGASGAIFGLAGALIASFYLGEFSLPRIAIQGTLRSLLTFAGFNLFFGFVIPGIDNSAHIGGMVSGLALGAVIARFAPLADAPLRRLSFIAMIALAVFASALGVRQWRGAPMRMARQLDELSEGGSGSIPQLQAFVREQPNSTEAHFALGSAYFRQQNFSQAADEFKRVVELSPRSTDAKYNLGISYFDGGRLDEAQAVFSQLLTQDANNPEGHFGLGLTLYKQEKFQAAIDQFKAAATVGPKMTGVNYELGRSYAKLQQYDSAIAAFLKEKDLSGDDLDLELALADVYQAKGLTQKAQEAQAQAAKLRGNVGR